MEEKPKVVTGRIDLSELNPHNYDRMDDVLSNLKDLQCRLNWVRKENGKPMIVTSGLRSDEDQEKLIAAGKSNATKSNHLTGKAADILDEDGSLYRWCKDNDRLLISYGLWMEERQGPWQHFQICPPRSGSRWFNP
jgi:hypothetical protein